MKAKKMIYSIIFFFLFTSLLQLNALEVGATFSLENLDFKNDRLSDDESFSGMDLLWGGSLFATHTISESFSVEGGFYNDTILRFISYTLLNYNLQFIQLSVGPFFGFFNSTSTSTILKSGISTSIKLELPGVLYISFRTDNSIGGYLIEIGDYIQQRNDISLGYHVRNAICSININSRKFIEKQDNLEVVDSLIDYSFKTDIFQKNLPYRIFFSFSFQRLSKKYFDAADSSAEPVSSHTLNSIILGTEVDINITDFLTVILNLESSIYTFGQDILLGISNPGWYLFRAYTGFKINFDRLSARRALPSF